MRVYATPEDLSAYPGGDTVPTGSVDLLLRAASGAVDTLMRGGVYDTDPAGLPTDPDVVQAFKDATCLIAIEAQAAGITAAGGTSEWSQVGIGNVSLAGRTAREGTVTVDGLPIPVLAAQALKGVYRLCVWVI